MASRKNDLGAIRIFLRKMTLRLFSIRSAGFDNINVLSHLVRVVILYFIVYPFSLLFQREEDQRKL